MFKITALFFITTIFAVGYWTYIDTNKRKEQNMLKLIQEANKTILTVENNPHNNMR
ncbi:hypothetical protein [Acinetobacter sp. Marseille-Q1623]|uniref:hypothetical protein n=1 Tax=Acinetobacter sp. Marseille-Q1623 TaxID=2697501 RepID=UPI00157B3D3F|nr:hypothetical protein [Acinetobacter sp. Marseille-Q1623]